MYSVKLTALAENVIRDGDRNNLSLINIIENVVTSNFPAVVPRMVSLWMLSREPDDPAKVTAFELVCSLGDEVQHQVSLEVNFNDRLATRALFTLDSYVLPHAGILTTSLRFNGAELGRYAIPVIAMAPPPQIKIRPT
jgi:hypothetical protein